MKTNGNKAYINCVLFMQNSIEPFVKKQPSCDQQISSKLDTMQKS